MTLLYDLRAVAITSPMGEVLSGLDWSVRADAVTVLMGPAGTGKSALLRGLSGRPAPAGWHRAGSWRYRGCDLLQAAPAVLDEVAWFPQPQAVRGTRDWREVLVSPASTLLLDEPTRGLAAAEADELRRHLRERAPGRAAVVVTHDVGFARDVADDVALLCAGRIVAGGAAEGFFEAPPNELAERFLRQGNCWPARPWPPVLPSHFHWILPGKLGGMGRPGLLGDIDTDLEALAASGVGLVVTLTEEPLPAEKLRAVGLMGRHFPIPDMGVPALGPTASLCREIERAMRDAAVAVHCRAGMGRTGTVLAAMLVWLGRSSDEAAQAVRAVARGYIQNAAQLDFVRRFAENVGPRRP